MLGLGQDKDKDPDKKFGGKGFGGKGFGQQERKLVKQFDKDNDGRLNNDERKAAREFIKKSGGGGKGGFGGFGGFGGGGKGGFGGPGGFGRGKMDPPKPGPSVTPAGGGGRSMALRSFADQRRAYLLNYPEIKKLPSAK